MLKSILSQEDCAMCRFCCSFRRKSLWETPLFDRASKDSLQKRFPGARFKQAGSESFTVDLLHLYKTDSSEEEAACPFLGEHGCVLSAEEKPFDCAIWPLRVCRVDKKIHVTLENTCPAVNRQPLAKIRELVELGVGKKIISHATAHPDMIKELQPGFVIVG